MTWSIVARDADGSFGVAIASRFFAVGALCMHTRRAVGALATQALMNPLYGPAGIELLAERVAAEEVVRRLTDADDGRAQRQLHLIGARGRGAAYTGAQCVEWCGHELHDDFSVAGNMLAGADVLQATAAAFIAAAGRPLAERLLAAMAAGEAAGGDKRGKQAAALRIHAARTIRASTCASTITSSRWSSCAACTKRASSASSRSSPAWPAATIRSAC